VSYSPHYWHRLIIGPGTVSMTTNDDVLIMYDFQEKSTPSSYQAAISDKIRLQLFLHENHLHATSPTTSPRVRPGFSKCGANR
jgi:hypothetical protein